MVQAFGNPLQHAQVEVDDIPAREHIGIDLLHPGAEEVQCGALIQTTKCALRHGASAAIDDQYLVDAQTIQ